MFGTFAFTSSWIVVIVHASPTFSTVQRAVVSILVGTVPFFSECAAQSHAEAGRFGGGEQLFGVRAFPVLEARADVILPSQTRSSAEASPSALEISLPLRTGAACRHGNSSSSVDSGNR